MYSYHYSLSCRNTAQTSVHNDTRQGTPPPTQQRLYPADNTRKRVSSSWRLGVTCLRRRGHQVSSLTKRRVLVSGCNLQKQCRAARRQTHASAIVGEPCRSGTSFSASSIFRQGESSSLSLCTRIGYNILQSIPSDSWLCGCTVPGRYGENLAGWLVKLF